MRMNKYRNLFLLKYGGIKNVISYIYTWMSDSITRKLQVFVNRCLKRILNVRWPIMMQNEKALANEEKIDMHIKKKGNRDGWDIH